MGPAAHGAQLMTRIVTTVLQSVGLEVDSKGAIVVDKYSHTNVDSIWAVGDITDRMNLTPVALMEGMAFAATAFGGTPTPLGYDKACAGSMCRDAYVLPFKRFAVCYRWRA